MAGKAKKRKGRPTQQELLKATPYRNERITVDERGDGTVMVCVPVRRPRYMVPPLSWLLPFSPERRIELDRLGGEVLNLCNGQTTVERIMKRFAGEHKLSFREAQVSVTEFLKMLTQRGIIVIIGRDKGGKAVEANRSM